MDRRLCQSQWFSHVCKWGLSSLKVAGSRSARVVEVLVHRRLARLRFKSALVCSFSLGPWLRLQRALGWQWRRLDAFHFFGLDGLLAWLVFNCCLYRLRLRGSSLQTLRSLLDSVGQRTVRYLPEGQLLRLTLLHPLVELLLYLNSFLQ